MQPPERSRSKSQGTLQKKSLLELKQKHFKSKDPSTESIRAVNKRNPSATQESLPPEIINIRKLEPPMTEPRPKVLETPARPARESPKAVKFLTQKRPKHGAYTAIMSPQKFQNPFARRAMSASKPRPDQTASSLERSIRTLPAKTGQPIRLRSQRDKFIKVPMSRGEFAESVMRSSNAYGVTTVRADFSPTASYMREVMRFRAKHASAQDKVEYFN